MKQDIEDFRYHTLQQLTFINIYKCLYKFDLGDTNVWMLDRRLVF